MEDEHSGPFWEERQKSLERAAKETAAEQAAVSLPVPVAPQVPEWTRESVLDFIRQHSIK